MITTKSDVQVGGVFVDRARSNQGRTLQVVDLKTHVIDSPDGAVRYDIAVCEVLTPPTAKPSARTGDLVRISLARLQSTAHYQPAKGDRK